MDAGTLIALAAMLVALFGAAHKYIDRRRALKKEEIQKALQQSNMDVERDSIVVRGAEGALLLMEKAMKAASEDCDKKIKDLEEEILELRCENNSLKVELMDMKKVIRELEGRIRNME